MNEAIKQAEAGHKQSIIEKIMRRKDDEIQEIRADASALAKDYLIDKAKGCDCKLCQIARKYQERE